MAATPLCFCSKLLHRLFDDICQDQVARSCLDHAPGMVLERGCVDVSRKTKLVVGALASLFV